MRFSSCVGGNRNYSQFYYELWGLFLLIISSGSLLALSNLFTSICQSLLKGALMGSSANLPCTFSVQPSLFWYLALWSLTILAALDLQLHLLNSERTLRAAWVPLPGRSHTGENLTDHHLFPLFQALWSFFPWVVFFFFNFVITDLLIYFLNFLLLENSWLTMWW